MPLDRGDRHEVPNVGYILLGEVVTFVAKQPYQRYVLDHVLADGYHACRFIDSMAKYRCEANVSDRFPDPAAGDVAPSSDATAGWAARSWIWHLTNLDGSRGQSVLSEKTRNLMLEAPPMPLKPRPDGTYYGLGWDSIGWQDKAFMMFKDGSYQGMRTFMKRLPAGVCWALLYNASMDFDAVDNQISVSTVQDVRRLVEGIEKYPDIDLFKEYP